MTSTAQPPPPGAPRHAADHPDGPGRTGRHAAPDPTAARHAAPDPTAATPPPGATPRVSRGRLVARRFARSRRGVAGLVVLAALFLLAYLGPLVSPWSHEQLDYAAFLTPPSPQHWFGTTQIGGDVFVLTMRGLQKSLLIGLLVGVVSTALAAVVGATAGYFGGRVDRALLWVIDLLLVLPAFLLLAILSPALRGQSWLLLVALLAGFGWMLTARIVRGLALSLREREFVTAARFAGVPARRIILRHIVPNMSSLLIIDATLAVGGAILAETGLSFFGFGVQPPDVSLGTLIASGTDAALTYPWLFAFPAGFLVVAVLAVNLVGDALRDAVDPGSPHGRRAPGSRP